MACTISAGETGVSEQDNGNGDRVHLALALAFETLRKEELARCRAVCKLWSDVASSLEVRRAVFVRQWRLGGLLGEPRSPSFMDSATLSHFVRRHPVCRTDTLPSLAVRHGCAVTAIKRLNNLISDHSLHSRTAVFLPVGSAAELTGAQAAFEYCGIACRELLVLLSPEELEQRAARQRAAQRAEGGCAEGEGEGGAGGGLSKAQAALRAKLVALLARSLRLEPGAARFYLEEAGWCARQAVELFEQDVRWESVSPGGRRRRGVSLAP
ncbi:hypothetical protein HYH03_007497 [Edaphochlamys debaryana]|uniref:LysM domain-containing protein n=1 Tax=Edaphochlamys debaryana TaxID=47281 RepID=A0A835Y208_9CHLO|nr:hypothetical protein HYH03_007497 [Edaphochlamys debaryana]|eukprot:KAG2494445.1 hypothetical protein HYH03_007497 [Edaphochlamys debaryana]